MRRRAAGPLPRTLAHTVETPALVDEVLSLAEAAGAEVGPGVARAWGGYSGCAADRDGVRWEVVWDPGVVGRQVVPGAEVRPRR